MKNIHKLEMKKDSLLEKQMKALKWLAIKGKLPVRWENNGVTHRRKS